MALTAGTRVGAYEIVGAIGAGGMGEVYRARDTNLGRDVAIKVLPDAFAADTERVARFDREARVLASLNHPNIAGIYGLERSPVATCLVMELAVGDTLDARLKPRAPSGANAIPPDEAILIATQIASALEAAHEKGIIHRDLKPANVVVAPDGKVKVLDFGLAKAIVGDADDAKATNLTHSPTAYGGTIAGVILGTAAYMSPEQARGKPVDKRTDIWSFGCVLFEMLAGRAPFTGETLTDIVASVVKNDPDWSMLPANTPRHVRAVLQRCLKKDPDQRLRDIGDARLELLESPREPVVAPAVVRSQSNNRVAWILAAVFGAFAALLAVLLTNRQAAVRAPVMHLEISPPPGVELVTWLSQSICISRDGAIVGFMGVRGGARNVFVRRLAQSEAAAVQGTDGANSCFFSPDGRSLGFIPSALTMKIASLGDGQVSTITKGASYTAGAAWGADGRITFGIAGDLWQVASTGGEPRRIVGVDRAKGETSLLWPTAVNDGRNLLVTSVTGETRSTMRVESVLVATGDRGILVEDAAFPLYADSGHLLFFRDGALFGAPFDASRLRLTGPATRLVTDVGVDMFGGAEAALSATGTLVYVPSTASLNRMMWVSREGVERAVTDGARAFVNPRIAPDGRTIAVTDNGDLWVHDTIRGAMTRLIPDSTRGNSFPVWTWDGKRVIFRTGAGLRIVDADGSGRVEPIPNTTVGDFATSVSRDGKTLVFQRQMAETSGDIYALTLGSKDQPRPIVSTAAYEGGGQLSPDDRWLAYTSDESGRLEVYLRPFGGADRKWPVSTQGGTQPRWRGDGRELFYRAGNKMMAVDVRPGDEPTLSSPRVLFEQPYAFGQGITLANYDVSEDGQRFVMVKETGSGRIDVVLNFTEELKRLAPVK